MHATEVQRICATLILGAIVTLVLPACGGGGDGDGEDLDVQASTSPGGDGSPAPGGNGSAAPGGDGSAAPGGDGDPPVAGACSAAGAADAPRRLLSNGERRPLVASCNGAAPGLIDIIDNFLPPPPVPASGGKR
jgi:hypothetical protein